jgi:hypothetical protein
VYNRADINKRILFNVLSTVFERLFINNILYILIYISLIHDLRALIYVPKDVFTALALDLDIVALE